MIESVIYQLMPGESALVSTTPCTCREHTQLFIDTKKASEQICVVHLALYYQKTLL